MMNNILKTDSLTVGYGKNVVVQDVNIEVLPGKIITLIGPNGSGKTTILKTILRQLEPISGCIYLSDIPFNDLKGADIAKKMAMVTTNRPKTDMMTCYDIIASGRYPYTGKLGLLTKDDIEKVNNAIDFMDVRDIVNRDFQAISDGQKQRVMIARAVCQEPEVLLLDEPTSFLDIKYKIDILNSIYKLARENNTAVVMSLHELDLAKNISDEIVCVENDKIGKIGRSEEVFVDGYIQKLYGIDKEYFDEEKGVIKMPSWS